YLTSNILQAAGSSVTPLLWVPGKRCDNSAISSSETPCLIVIWMAVAPVPVILVMFVVLFVVGTIVLVPFCQIASVGAVFAVIPVVVVVVVGVIHSDLHAGFWRCPRNRDRPARRKGSRQK